MILAVLWTAFIVYGLTSEPSGIPKFPWLAFHGADKLIHFVMFAIESLLVLLVLRKFSLYKTIPLVLLWCFLLGGGLEIFQYLYIDGRSGDGWDLLADMIGAVAGTATLFLITKKY